MRLTPDQRTTYEQRLKALNQEFAAQQAAPDATDAQYYEVLVGVYPTLAPPADAVVTDE